MKSNTLSRLGVLTAAMGMILSSGAFAANSGQANVTFEVQEVDDILLSGNPAPLTITSAVPGEQPTDATDSTTNWAITSNKGTNGKKLTAAINSNMPANVTLKVAVTGPTGSVGGTATALSTSSEDVVTGIDQVAESDLPITYTLSATVAAGIVTSDSKTVTFTLTDS